jgi:hypothetical protein
MGRRVWEVSLHQDVEAWYLSICQNDPETADLIEQAVELLAAEARRLGGRSWTESRAASTTT